MIKMETQEIIGQIVEKGVDFIKLKKDNKTIKINFRGKNEEIIKNIEVSESYKITYLDNIKDGFTYHNGKKVEPILIKQEATCINKVPPQFSSSEVVLTPTDKNAILITASNLFIETKLGDLESWILRVKRIREAM
jgi:hypothetical protein